MMKFSMFTAGSSRLPRPLPRCARQEQDDPEQRHLQKVETIHNLINILGMYQIKKQYQIKDKTRLYRYEIDWIGREGLACETHDEFLRVGAMVHW